MNFIKSSNKKNSIVNLDFISEINIDLINKEIWFRGAMGSFIYWKYETHADVEYAYNKILNDFAEVKY